MPKETFTAQMICDELKRSKPYIIALSRANHIKFEKHQQGRNVIYLWDREGFLDLKAVEEEKNISRRC